MSKQVGEYEYHDLGVDHAQYFPGFGSREGWEGVFVGVGDTLEDAMNDAAEMCASSCEWDDVPSADETFMAKFTDAEWLTSAHADCDPNNDEMCELGHYCVLFVNSQVPVNAG